MAGRLGARRYTTLACRAAQSEARLSLTALADLLEELADDLPALLPTPQRPLPQPGSARARGTLHTAITAPARRLHSGLLPLTAAAAA